MNTRRKILHYLGLGSLFATFGAVNQSRGASFGVSPHLVGDLTKGLKPVSSGWVADEIRECEPGQWVMRYRVIDSSPLREKRPLERILEETVAEGWKFVGVAGPFGDQLIFECWELREAVA